MRAPQGEGGDAAAPRGAGILELPPEQRSALFVAERAGRAEDVLRQQGKCPRCALVAAHCICEGLSDLRQRASAPYGGGRHPVRFALWTHASEKCRASNTGKLLLGALPEGCCEVFVHGMPGEAERLDRALGAAGGRAHVLYPSPEAISVAEALAPVPSGALAESSSPPALVVLIDGTWHQAKRMRKALEGLPHVALAHGPGCSTASQFGWRRQSEASRVTTAEAAAALLEELLTSNVGSAAQRDDADPQVSRWAEALRTAVAMLDEALKSQSHYSKDFLEPREPWHERQLAHMLARMPDGSARRLEG